MGLRFAAQALPISPLHLPHISPISPHISPTSPMGLRVAAQAVVGILLIFLYSWKLSLVMLSIVPLVAFAAVG